METVKQKGLTSVKKGHKITKETIKKEATKWTLAVVAIYRAEVECGVCVAADNWVPVFH
jgi:hypothetical protein